MKLFVEVLQFFNIITGEDVAQVAQIKMLYKQQHLYFIQDFRKVFYDLDKAQCSIQLCNILGK